MRFHSYQSVSLLALLKYLCRLGLWLNPRIGRCTRTSLEIQDGRAPTDTEIYVSAANGIYAYFTRGIRRVNGRRSI